MGSSDIDKSTTKASCKQLIFDQALGMIKLYLQHIPQLALATRASTSKFATDDDHTQEQELIFATTPPTHLQQKHPQRFE